MNVFNSVGDMYKLQKEARMMKKKMDEQKIVGESKNKMVKIYMTASQELQDIFINEEWFENASSEDVKKCFKEAFKDYSKKLQKVMMSSMDLDQLKGLLGK